MLGISDRQFYQTMKMLSDDGYVRGVEFMDVTQPKNSVLDHPRNWYITSDLIFIPPCTKKAPSDECLTFDIKLF